MEAERAGLEERLHAREAEISYLHDQLSKEQQQNETHRLRELVSDCSCGKGRSFLISWVEKAWKDEKKASDVATDFENKEKLLIAVGRDLTIAQITY